MANITTILKSLSILSSEERRAVEVHLAMLRLSPDTDGLGAFAAIILAAMPSAWRFSSLTRQAEEYSVILAAAFDEDEDDVYLHVTWNGQRVNLVEVDVGGDMIGDPSSLRCDAASSLARVVTEMLASYAARLEDDLTLRPDRENEDLVL